MPKCKVGLIGRGFVGSALEESFTKRGYPPIVYDKYLNLGSIQDLAECSVVFLCLPTPYVEGHGFELGALIENLKLLKELQYAGICVIKSTVEPGVTERLSGQFGLCILHNPEFLSERSSFIDFDNQKNIIIGSTNSCKDCDVDLVSGLYMDMFPEAKVTVCSSSESEAMKLFCNNFYAIKVQIFNEFYFLCQKLNIDYDIIKQLMISNNWINQMHTIVPGPDGSVSYGGACFPKDTNALLHFMRTMNSPHKILEACVAERNLMRKD